MATDTLFPITLADGSELSEDGAKCYFLSPNVLVKHLAVLHDGRATSAKLHRPYAGIPMRLEIEVSA